MKLMTAMGAIAIAILASTAHAKEQNTITYNGTKVNQPYVGLKVGQMDTNTTLVLSTTAVSADGNVSRTEVPFATAGHTNVIGIYGGYNFDKHFGAEAEFMASAKKDFRVGGIDMEQKTNAFGAYGTFRYDFENTPFYAKAKLGVARTNLDVEAKSLDSKLEGHKTGTAYGLGAGYQTGNIGIEATFSRPHKDVDVVSLGASMAF